MSFRDNRPFTVREFTVDEVTALLIESKAPKKLLRPELIHNIAHAMLFAYDGRLGSLPPEEIKERDLRKKAQKAVNELRKLLPEIRVFTMSRFVSITIGGGKKGLEEPLVAEALLARHLVDLDIPHVTFRPPIWDWHRAAAHIWVYYRDVVGHASTSHTGPAVRFIQVALRETGYGAVELGTIEKSLKRWRDEILSPKAMVSAI